MAEATIDEVLDVLGFGRMQFTIFFGCALLQLYVTNEQFGLALVTVAARSQFLSSHFMGFQSDAIGRRKLLLISSLLSMIFSFISSLMPEFWSFLVLRFIVGCVLTGPGMALLTYMSEFTKISLRAKVINFLCYSIGISMIYMPATAMALMPLELHVKICNSYYLTSWRVLMMTNLLPGLIGWIIVFYMPESPKYYLSVDKPQEALQVLEKCCRYNKGKDVTLSSLNIGTLTQPHAPSDTAPAKRNCFYRIWFETKPLFRGIYLRQMMLSISILFVLFGESFGLMVWMPRVLKKIEQIQENLVLCNAVKKSGGLNSAATDTNCDLDIDNLRVAIIVGGCCLGCFMLGSVLLLFLNRKTILMAFTTIAAFGGFLLNFVPTNVSIVIAYILLTVPALCSLRLALSVLIDAIPTHLRTKAVAMSMTCGRIGVLFVNMFVGYTLNWNCFFTYNTFVVLLLVCVILISLLPKKAISN